MRSYELTRFGPDGLIAKETDEPRPKVGEVLIRMRAASLNYRDLMIAAGTYNPRMKLPAVPLSDGAGEVIEVGAGVTRWSVGDRVSPILVQGWIDGGLTDQNRKTAIGGGAEHPGVLREYAVFPERGLVQVPDELSYREAAAMPCAAVTAWNALHISGTLRPGDTVLTIGTGGVSVFALQIAKMSGASVIAITRSGSKMEQLKQLGADEMIDSSNDPEWERAVLAATARRGVDHVVEVGGSGTLTRSVRSVRVGGHIAMIGALSTGGEFDPISAFMRSVRLSGIFVGSGKMHSDVLRAFSANGIKPVIDSVYDFSQVKEAFERMQKGEHFGKIVIDIG